MKTNVNARPFIYLTAFEVIWVLAFALTAVTLKTVPAPVLAAGRGIAGFALVAVMVGGRPRKKPGRTEMIQLGLAGAIGMAAFLLFQVVFRYSNAPSASDIAFITGLSPLFVLPLALFWKKERVGLRQVIGMAVAMLGMVAVLGNWEKPSSLWLFTRFFKEEAVLLLSAVAWAAVTMIGRRLSKSIDPATQSYYMLGFASVPLVLYALTSGGLSALLKIDLSNLLALLFLGVFGTGLALYFWLKALSEVESHRASSVLLLTPLLLSLYLLVDRKIAALPIDLPAVIFGLILIAVGFAAAISMPEREPNVADVGGLTLSGPLAQLLAILASVGLLSAIASLALPIRENFVAGFLDSGKPYKAAWSTFGYAVIGSYLLLFVSVYLLVSSIRFLRGRLAAGSLFVAGMLSVPVVLGSFVVAGTPFSAWYTWMPVEVQQAFGTEYAKLQEINQTNFPLLFGSVVSLLGSLIVVAAGFLPAIGLFAKTTGRQLPRRNSPEGS
ncbi:MAG: DMT family transporter [Actinobacteria bacterium]|nr:DMT family transporter [Actinomycetota bacterium]